MASDPSNPSSARPVPPHSTVRRDLAWVLALTVLAAVLSARFDFSEHAYRWTRGLERFQLDELPGTLCVLSIGLAWFAWRRYREARRELIRRCALEEQAERLLAENRRLANQALQAQELERRHLARELHDELGQYLNAISLDAARIRDLSSAREPEVHRVSLGLIQSASHVYRQIGGMIRRLRPIGLDEFGLPSALEHCVDGWRERLPDASFSLTIEGDFTGLSDALTITLYRLVQEGLTNVSKFARTARVEVFMVRAPREARERQDGRLVDEIVVTMADDGPGADLDKPRGGLGLIGMRERVEALGGEFHVASRPEGGFLFCARVPAHAGLAEPVN
ncbi:histidine kinase family protein [Paraburkholderia xenovorans LB400]|uniref:histidine kinase n=1 Tax=Paraburkholderia xenovorans (strain LB400) TaxID=266265 RepID=Q13QX0_PARXL|nr:histidine kinase [Paraburkholderia xenovorans]ABE33519.1 Periplasmic Sensor signal transduction Histidine Kinase [Paraburkholderia xenovorans LB400]AIP37196.1 histidine kinase family protein [Paraburkholderia xenovorans LB400]